MGELALRQGHPDRLAVAGLAERIAGDEPDLDRQAGPGMRRQIVVARRLSLFEVQPGERQRQFDRLVGLAVRAPDHRLDVLDPVIVLGLIVEPQYGAGGPFGRSGESDGRRIVGHDLDRPIAERGAVLRHLEPLAGGQGRRNLEVLLVDCGEVARLAVDDEARQAVAVMHLG